jgi:predicted RNase H-like HicB family nuclease
MPLQQIIHAIIRPGEDSGYVVECTNIHAVTQGGTLDEAVANLREVVALALEGEDLAELGLAPNPVLVASLELELLSAVA